MRSSDTIKEISGALLKAQMAIKAAIKDATNPHFRSKYADLSSVIEAVKEPLNKNSISFIQPVSFDEHGVLVETVLLHTSGEWISGTLAIPVSKHDAQGVGSAISYGRRYGLQSMCGVPAEDDDGNAATASAKDIGARGKVAPARRKIIEDTVVLIKDALAEDRDFDAFGYCEPFTAGDPDEKSYLWSFLDSSQRSRIKAQSAISKQQKAA